MTGKRVPYLAQRGSVYQLRLPVPKHLQSRMACKEIQRSICTKDYGLAKRIALRGGSNFADLCASLEHMTNMTTVDVHALIERFFRTLLASFEPADPVPPSSYDWDKNHQEYAAEGDVRGTGLEVAAKGG